MTLRKSKKGSKYKTSSSDIPPCSPPRLNPDLSFLSLPAEIRLIIYTYHFNRNLQASPLDLIAYRNPKRFLHPWEQLNWERLKIPDRTIFNILLTNKTILAETLPLLRTLIQNLHDPLISTLKLKQQHQRETRRTLGTHWSSVRVYHGAETATSSDAAAVAGQILDAMAKAHPLSPNSLGIYRLLWDEIDRQSLPIIIKVWYLNTRRKFSSGWVSFSFG